MSVQYNINSENQDKRSEQGRRRLQDWIWFSLRCPFGGMLLPLLVCTKKDHHAGGGDKEHMGFSQCIKSTVIQDHPRHDVDGAGLCKTFFDVSLHHLIGSWIICASKSRKVGYRKQENGDQRKTKKHSHTAIDPLENRDPFGLRPFFIPIIQLFQRLKTLRPFGFLFFVWCHRIQFLDIFF